MCYEQNKVRNGVVGEGQRLGSSQEAESRVNVVAEDANNPAGRTIQVHDGLQLTAQPQPQGPAIHWERFLPVRSLKVLLVENDDSTRHVVSALLRNCSYEVTAVANGFQAWKILEDLSNHIDLILTEVAMPFISGIALLSKIMSHKTFKNIPVVMMSSHDSMGIVFKCLSKGAVDFLVKPIRKNELKNLWQHIWRRCHSSSGSGSESGTQSKKSVKSKSVNESGNNTATSDEEDNRINSPNIQDGSDSGSGTQSSWTKTAAKIGSPLQGSAWEQVADAPDSTCAQVIHTKPDTINHQQMRVTETNEWQEHDEQLVDSKSFGRSTEQDNEIISGKLRDKGQKRSRENVDIRNPQTESKTFDGPSALSSISQFKNKVKRDSGELPSLEQSLKRARKVEDTGNTEQDDRTVLRHSDSSAFSKYNTASSANQGLTGNVGSCSPLDNSSVAMKTEKMQNYPSHSNSTPPNQQSNGSSNNNDMASTKYVTLKEEALINKSEPISAFKCFRSSAVQPVQNSVACPPQQLPPGKTDDVQTDTNCAQPKGLQQQVQVQHHHHYYHHFHHHVHNTKQHKQEHDHGDSSLKNMAAAVPQCGSSNVFVGPIEGNTGNCSVNGSASGSNHGSNGQNGSSTALKAEPLNMESDVGTAGKSGGGGTSGKISGEGGDESRVAHREAALSKFRQKRKERCFDKRVRYESRKKLAEQRPRVRGQFVRQIMPDANSSKDNQSNDLVSEDNSFDSIQ